MGVEIFSDGSFVSAGPPRRTWTTRRPASFASCGADIRFSLTTRAGGLGLRLGQEEGQHEVEQDPQAVCEDVSQTPRYSRARSLSVKMAAVSSDLTIRPLSMT